MVCSLLKHTRSAFWKWGRSIVAREEGVVSLPHCCVKSLSAVELSGCCLFSHPDVLGLGNWSEMAVHQAGNVACPDAAELATSSCITWRGCSCTLPLLILKLDQLCKRRSVNVEQLAWAHLLCFTYWNIIANH